MTSEAEERAQREVEEGTEEEDAMEPQEVQTESEQSEAKEDTLEGEEPESAEASRPPDDDTEEAKQEMESACGSPEIPPLQNGTPLYVCSPVHALTRQER